MVPIFLTLGGVQVARFASTSTRRLAAALLVLGAAIWLIVLRPEQAISVAIGVLVSVLWSFVVQESPAGSPWRVARPVLGLLLLGVAILVQAQLLGLVWTTISAAALDLILVLLLLEPATRAVRLVLAVAGSSVSGINVGAGEMIGVLERLIIFLLILTDGYAAIGFVIAAKGLARYEKMKDEKQAEYVLLGTLASVFLVLLAGVARRP
jgi:hypothetical protein